MGWFNYYGLIVMAIIMIPNIVYAVKRKGDDAEPYSNKIVTTLEQIGRYGCMLLMVFNIPFTYIGFYFSFGEIVYCIGNAALLVAYILSWIVLFKHDGIVKALLLSILPSLIFLFSGAMIASVPLSVFAVVFSVSHVLISVKNARRDGSIDKKKCVVTLTALSTAVVLAAVGVFGGILGYRQSQLHRLETMSVRDMIEYCCTDKNAKISVAVIENGQTTYRVYGKSGEENAIYDYEIGSISKTFVGLLCAKAVREGKIALSDSIASYLDLDGEKYYPTIERLLTHTSGYRAYYFDSRMIANRFAHTTNDYFGIDKDRILRTVKRVSLEDKTYPFVYSNFGISVVGLVLETVYRDTFVNIMNAYIRDELHLENTQTAKQSGNLDRYWKWKETDGYVPAGAIVSDIEDMARYLRLYLTDGIAYASDCCEKNLDIRATNAIYEKLNIRTDGVGLTWMIDDRNGIVWHNGATTDFNAYMGFTADRKTGVVILSNLGPNDKISMTVIGAKLLTTREAV